MSKLFKPSMGYFHRNYTATPILLGIYWPDDLPGAKQARTTTCLSVKILPYRYGVRDGDEYNLGGQIEVN